MFSSANDPNLSCSSAREAKCSAWCSANATKRRPGSVSGWSDRSMVSPCESGKGDQLASASPLRRYPGERELVPGRRADRQPHVGRVEWRARASVGVASCCRRRLCGRGPSARQRAPASSLNRSGEDHDAASFGRRTSPPARRSGPTDSLARAPAEPGAHTTSCTTCAPSGDSNGRCVTGLISTR